MAAKTKTTPDTIRVYVVLDDGGQSFHADRDEAEERTRRLNKYGFGAALHTLDVEPTAVGLVRVLARWRSEIVEV